MACCVIASFIIAQCVATVRRWGMFWGLISVPEGETADTLYGLMRGYLNSRAGRMVVCSVVAFEFAAAAGWVYVNHGEHVREFVDVAWARLQGDTVVYGKYCTKDGLTKARLLLPQPAQRS